MQDKFILSIFVEKKAKLYAAYIKKPYTLSEEAIRRSCALFYRIIKSV